MLLETLSVDRDELAARTGWHIEPQGACKGDVCVPLPADVQGDDGRLDATVLAERLGMPLVHDETHGLWALGPESQAGRALTGVEAPDLVLPDIRTGEPFALSSLRGQRVALVAWAPW
jgi:hypothetical protein